MHSYVIPHTAWKKRFAAAFLILAILAPASAALLTAGASPKVVLPITLGASMALAAAAAAHRAKPATRADSFSRLLFVDDEARMRTVIGEMLARHGFEVTTAVSVIDALKHLLEAAEAFDLVIVDLAMPSVTGADLLAQLSRTRPRIPIILLTAQYRASDDWPTALTRISVMQSTAPAEVTKRIADLLSTI